MDDLIEVKLVTVPGGVGGKGIEEKFALFFPPLEASCKSGWVPMAETYIKEWWRVLKTKTNDEQKDLGKKLLRLFRCCQCLPNATVRGPWVPGRNGEVVLVVNPEEYHDELQTNSTPADGTKQRRQRRKVTKTNAAFRQSIIGVIGSRLGISQRSRVEKRFQQEVRQKKQAQKKKVVGANDSDTDDDQPPVPRGKTWRRGRGGRGRGRGRKVGSVKARKAKKSYTSSESTSERAEGESSSTDESSDESDTN